jgi:hypothetical protein
MRSLRWVVSCVGLCAIGIITFFAVRKFQRDRDLAETLQWMDQTYNPHDGGENYGQGHGKQVHFLEDTQQQTETITEDFEENFSYSKCYVSLHSTTLPVGIIKEMPSNTVYKFNLGVLDPDSMKLKTYDFHKDGFNCSDPEEVKTFNLDCREAELEISTRNGATSIDEETDTTFTNLTGADHESHSSSKKAMVWFDLDDLAYAERFEKALKHAIELCGGRASKF